MKRALRIMALVICGVMTLTDSSAQANDPAALEAGEADVIPEVPEEFRAAYFAARPKAFLVDPQRVLKSSELKERLDFLNYHSNDSLIDIFVYVFPESQQLPEELEVDEWIKRVYSDGRPAVVVLYFYGAPDKARLQLSPSLHDVILETERRRALEGAVMQAGTKVESAEQLKAFTVQISIRTYWMERALNADTEDEPKTIVEVKPQAKGQSDMLEMLALYLEPLRPFLYPVGLSVSFLMITFALLVWLKWRSRYEFPDFAVEPRLGGSHAAGVGGVISFATNTVTPASQRDQLPEATRRH